MPRFYIEFLYLSLEILIIIGVPVINVNGGFNFVSKIRTSSIISCMFPILTRSLRSFILINIMLTYLTKSLLGEDMMKYLMSVLSLYSLGGKFLT